tara:strand:- start:246 stop:806 length:561 start_codon:yes stop_codon:yes gene_type:complete
MQTQFDKQKNAFRVIIYKKDLEEWGFSDMSTGEAKKIMKTGVQALRKNSLGDNKASNSQRKGNEKKTTESFSFEEEATQALRLILAYLGQLLIDNSNKTYETESVLLHSNINDCTLYQRIARQFLYIEGLQRCVHEKFKHNPFPMHNEIKDLIPEHILQWAKVNDPKLFGAATRAWDRKDSGNSNA